MGTAIGTLGTRDTLTVAGGQFADLTALKCLIAAGSAATGHSSGKELGAGAGYLVPVNKTFRILALEVNVDTTDAIIGLGYCTNDVGTGTTTGYSGYVDALAGVGTPQGFYQKIPSTPTALISLKMDIPAGKYVAITYISGTGGGVMRVFGMEI